LKENVKKISERSTMQDDPPSSEDQQWILRFPNRPDLVLAFMTNAGGTGFPAVGLQYEGMQPVAYAMSPHDLANLLPVILAMIDRGVQIMDDGDFETLQEALKSRKLPENVISLFDRRKK
jgi:hypothetical protein